MNDTQAWTPKVGEKIEIPVVDNTSLADKYRQTAIPSNEIGRPLMEAGLIPQGCRRFLIDCEVGQAVKIYCEAFPTGGLIESIFETITKKSAEYTK